jgi:hypothetical protein
MTSDTSGSGVEWNLSGGRVGAFAVLLLIDFLLILVMLGTDMNLQTDFGSVAKYYAHWYGLLFEGILDLILAVGLLATVALPALRGRSVSSRRGIVLLGVVWSVLAIVAMVGIVETYQQVGFSSASQFAQYLFGTTAYPGALSYIPWLYDALLTVYVLTALVGVISLMKVRSTAGRSSSA